MESMTPGYALHHAPNSVVGEPATSPAPLLSSLSVTAASVLIFICSGSEGRRSCPGKTGAYNRGMLRSTKASLVSLTEFSESSLSPSCVHLLRELQIDHITVMIVALSHLEKIGSHKISLAQVLGWSHINLMSRSMCASSQNRWAWDQWIKACSRSSSLALQSLHKLTSLICLYFKVLSSGRIPRSTLHQSTLTFGTTLRDHKAFHNWCSFIEVPVANPSS